MKSEIGILAAIIVILIVLLWRQRSQILKAKDDEIVRLNSRNEKLTELLLGNKENEIQRLTKQNEQLLNASLPAYKKEGHKS